MGLLADQVLTPATAGAPRLAVCIAHNWYRSAIPSGENRVVEREEALLRSSGVAVRTLYRRSDDLMRASILAKARAALSMLGGPRQRRRLRELLREAAPDATVLHAHNLFPAFGYELFAAAKELGMRTVQTLHNYRMLATAGYLLDRRGLRRPSTPEEQELHRRLHVRHHAGIEELFYRQAYRRMWEDRFAAVDQFICLTEFQRRLMEEAGVPGGKLVVKPNFIGHGGPIGTGPGDYALFVGRGTPEKGFDQLLEAWRDRAVPLKVAGGHAQHGPASASIEFLGPQPSDGILRLMAGARFLVLNSRCFESFPVVIVEALSSGTPCLVPRLGPLPEIVRDGDTGYCFEPGDLASLRSNIDRIWAEGPSLRGRCRARYEEHYTPEACVKSLVSCYADSAVRD